MSLPTNLRANTYHTTYDTMSPQLLSIPMSHVYLQMRTLIGQSDNSVTPPNFGRYRHHYHRQMSPLVDV
jgi:hypothetical protein